MWAVQDCRVSRALLQVCEELKPLQDLVPMSGWKKMKILSIHFPNC